jgi:hypothetical protein
MSRADRFLAFLGNAAACFVATASGLPGWIPHLTGMSLGTFLAINALLALAFAWMMTRQDSR